MSNIQLYCKCDRCGDYFEIGGVRNPARKYCKIRCPGKTGECPCGKELTRTNQLYCSKACKQWAYRLRKSEEV